MTVGIRGFEIRIGAWCIFGLSGSGALLIETLASARAGTAGCSSYVGRWAQAEDAVSWFAKGGLHVQRQDKTARQLDQEIAQDSSAADGPLIPGE